MHSICIGLVKRLLELTFNIGLTRTRLTSRKLSAPTDFNSQMKKQKVPREFFRRARQLDFGVLKAQEMRNIILFFPHCHCMHRETSERKGTLAIVGIRC